MGIVVKSNLLIGNTFALIIKEENSDADFFLGVGFGFKGRGKEVGILKRGGRRGGGGSALFEEEIGFEGEIDENEKGDDKEGNNDFGSFRIHLR